MKKLITVTLVLLFASNSFAQKPKINLVYFFGGQVGVTKIKAEAAMNRSTIAHLNYYTGGQDPMALSSDLKGIILVLSGDNEHENDHLVKTYRFVKAGGRAVIFVTTSGVDKFSELMTDYFSVVPVNEIIVDKTYVDNSKYLPYFGKGKIGVGSRSGKKVYFSNVYFRSFSENIVDKTTITSSSTNKDRIISLKMKVGSGEVIIASGQNCFRKGGFGANSLFFADEHYDLYDNEQIVIEMIRYLIGL